MERIVRKIEALNCNLRVVHGRRETKIRNLQAGNRNQICFCKCDRFALQSVIDLLCDLLKLSKSVWMKDRLGVKGLWQPQRKAFFDVSIVNTDSDSMSNNTLETIFKTRRNLECSTYLETAKVRTAI